MIAAAAADPTHARRQPLAYIEALPDADVVALAREVLPLPAPPERLEVAEDGTYPGFEGESLVFTEEEGRARLERAIEQARAGQTILLEEFNRRRAAKRAAGVQR